MKKLFTLITAFMFLLPMNVIGKVNKFMETNSIDVNSSIYNMRSNPQEIPWRINNGEEYIINPPNRMIKIYINLDKTSNSINVECHGGGFAILPGATGTCSTDRIIKLSTGTSAHGTYIIRPL